MRELLCNAPGAGAPSDQAADDAELRVLHESRVRVVRNGMADLARLSARRSALLARLVSSALMAVRSCLRARYAWSFIKAY